MMVQNSQKKQQHVYISHNWRWSLDDNRTLDVLFGVQLGLFFWVGHHGTNPHQLVSCLYNDGYETL